MSRERNYNKSAAGSVSAELCGSLPGGGKHGLQHFQNCGCHGGGTLFKSDESQAMEAPFHDRSIIDGISVPGAFKLHRTVLGNTRANTGGFASSQEKCAFV